MGSVFKLIQRIFSVLKWIAILLAILLVAAGAYVWFAHDDLLRRLTPRIEAALEQSLNAEVQFSGLEVVLFPTAGISVHAISIKPASSCGAISAENSYISFDLPALIKGRYIIDELVLSSAKANVSLLDGKVALVSAQDGSCNGDTQPPVVPAIQESQSAAQSSQSATFLNLKKLELRDLQLSVIGTKGHVLLISHLSGGALLNNGKITLRSPLIRAALDSLPISLSAKTVEFDSNSITLVVDEAVLNADEQIVKVSGTVQSLENFKELKISATGIELPRLHQTAKSLGLTAPIIESGKASLSVSLNTTVGQELEVNGELRVANLDIISQKLKISELVLRSARLLRSKTGNFNIAASALVRGFSIVDGSDSYRATKVEGPIKYSRRSSESKIDGDLTIEGFGFNDGLTELRNVSARLSNIEGVIGAKGDVKFSTSLDGSSIELLHPAIEIKRASKVTAPLTILVPKGGGYSVAGVVTAKGGFFNLSGRELNDVEGEVRMLVSTPIKEFEANHLSTVTQGRFVSTRGVFTMKADSYRFEKFKGAVNKGQFAAKGSIARDKGRAFVAEVAIKDVEVVDLLSLGKGKEHGPIEGTASKLNGAFSGTMNSPLESLKGNGSVQIVGSAVKGFNLSRAIGNAISAIPFSNITVSADNLTDDGRSKSAEGEFIIAEKRINLKNAVIYRLKYTVRGSGTVSFDGELNAKASVIFLQETLKNLGGGFERLGAMMGRIGKVEIPLFITGVSPNFSVTPDLVTLAKDNSGITLVGDVLGTTYKAGRAVTDFVLSPFGSKKATPTAAATPNSP